MGENTGSWQEALKMIKDGFKKKNETEKEIHEWRWC